jgi:uncharacterized protein YihD (DUF1040 family)
MNMPKPYTENQRRRERMIEFLQRFWATKPEMSLGEVVTYLARETGVATVSDNAIIKEIGRHMDKESGCDY